MTNGSLSCPCELYHGGRPSKGKKSTVIRSLSLTKACVISVLCLGIYSGVMKNFLSTETKNRLTKECLISGCPYCQKHGVVSQSP